jgi:preprotein translocase subunit SecF
LTTLSKFQLANYKVIRFVNYSKLWLTIGLIVIATGIAFMARNYSRYQSPWKLGVDFTQGDLIRCELGKAVRSDEVKEIVKKYTDREPTVQVASHDPKEVEIRLHVPVDVTKSLAEQNRDRSGKLEEMKNELSDKFGGFTLKNQAYVGPTVGKELTQKAILALIIANVLILIYVWFRFNNFIFAAAAIVALVHDVMFLLGWTAALGLEINSSFIAVVLTIIGYSMQDTIIIFDRIRENLRNHQTLEFNELCNLSLTQTLTRSINTVLTVVITLLTLITFGGESIRDFSVALAGGVVSGAYSSIFIATPVVILCRRKEPQRVKSIAEITGKSAPGAAPAAVAPTPPKAAPAPQEAPPATPAVNVVEGAPGVTVVPTPSQAAQTPKRSAPKPRAKKPSKKARRR